MHLLGTFLARLVMALRASAASTIISLRNQHNLLLALLVIGFILTAVHLWFFSSVGCVPTPLPSWTPGWLEYILEVRCGA